MVFRPSSQIHAAAGLKNAPYFTRAPSSALKEVVPSSMLCRTRAFPGCERPEVRFVVRQAGPSRTLARHRKIRGDLCRGWFIGAGCTLPSRLLPGVCGGLGFSGPPRSAGQPWAASTRSSLPCSTSRCSSLPRPVRLPQVALSCSAASCSHGWLSATQSWARWSGTTP